MFLGIAVILTYAETSEHDIETEICQNAVKFALISSVQKVC